MSFDSNPAETNGAMSGASCQEQIQSLPISTTPLDELNIVSLDPRYSDDEIKRVSFVFENRIADLFANSRFAEVVALIQPIIDSFPGIWTPVQEHEDFVIRAFWDEREFLYYQHFHSKPVRWGLPTLSRLFYLMAAAESRLLQFSLAHASLLNACKYEPDHPDIWMAKGSLLNRENRFEEALEAYRTAITTRMWTPPPVIANCLHGQGLALRALHRLAEAKESLGRAVELAPEHEAATRDLIRVDYDLKELRKRHGGA